MMNAATTEATKAAASHSIIFLYSRSIGMASINYCRITVPSLIGAPGATERYFAGLITI